MDPFFVAIGFVLSLGFPLLAGSKFFGTRQLAKLKLKLADAGTTPPGKYLDWHNVAVKQLKKNNFPQRILLTLLPLVFIVPPFIVSGELGMLVAGLLGLSIGCLKIGLMGRYEKGKNGISNWEVFNKLRMEAGIEALLKEDSKDAQQLLAAPATHPSSKLKLRFASVLGQRKEPAALPILAHLLEDESPAIRKISLSAMVKKRSPLLITHLPRLLADENKEIVGLTQKAMSGLLAAAPESETEQNATEDLFAQVKRIHEQLAYLQSLAPTFEDHPQKEALEWIMKELGTGTWASMLATSEAIGFENPPDRSQLDLLLQQFQQTPDLPPLISVMWKLKGQPGARNIYYNLLFEPDPEVQEEARIQLCQLAVLEPLNRKEIEPLINHAEVRMVKVGIQLLAHSNSTNVPFWVTSFLELKEVEIRALTLREIPNLKNPTQYYHYIEKALLDADQEIRFAAFDAAGKCGDPHWFFRLIEELEKGITKGTKNWVRGEEKKMRAAITEMRDELMYVETPPEELLCSKCLARTRTEKVNQWKYYPCRRCNTINHLQPGIKFLVGVIGEEAAVETLPSETLYVNVWNEMKKEAVLADIDALQIVGGKEMDYDWAVSAVLESQDNFQLDPTFKVGLKDNPPLSTNTKLRLAQFDKN